SGVVPGLLTMVGFSLMLIIIALRAPHQLPSGSKVSWREKFACLPGLFPLAILFIVVLGGIYTGIVTPTEAAAVGAMTTFIMTVIALLRRRATWSETRQAFRETISTSAMLFTLFVGAGIFSFFLTMAGVPFAIERAITGSSLPAVGVLLVVTVIYLILGMFLDPMSIMVITIPIVYPTMMALGYNGIWLGVIVVKLIGIGLLTPPVGLNVYVVKSVVPDLTLDDAFKGIGVFLIAEVVLLAILLAFPELSLWLPARMK
ncbi:MAG: transporter large permease, partial [Dehalococcoidia bacterium]|nr:transporter large permease [Dehalococcoidia bacterium]